MKIAIVGGGFSGLLAAHLLEKEGFDVTVYEKESTIGGYCKTISNIYNPTNLGPMVFSNDRIKELFIELQLEYNERFIHRCFIDENFCKTEQIDRKDTTLLCDDLKRLNSILSNYSTSLCAVNYANIHEDLMISIKDFLHHHNLRTIHQIMEPFLSSVGYGSMENISAYYAFKAFNIDTLYSLILGHKQLSVKHGSHFLVQKLSQSITDIRTSLEVTGIEVSKQQVCIRTPFSQDSFDLALITTKLPSSVLKDTVCQPFMDLIETNSLMTCIFDVKKSNNAKTYFKANLGHANKIQYYYPKTLNKRTSLIAHAYGLLTKDTINAIASDINEFGISINSLKTVQQWSSFPHIDKSKITPSIYTTLIEQQKEHPIRLIGGLISPPNISNMYLSVLNSVKEITDEWNHV